MDPVKPAPRGGVLFYVGSAGLLLVMLIETIAVIGRHVRIPLLGALELAQAAILPAACASMVIASLAGTHAVVHLLTERVPPPARRVMDRASALLAALFFGGLAIAAAWLVSDFWSTFEESDVLHIPFRPLRIVVAVSAGALSLIFAHRAVRRGEQP
jgi:TRAP-type C4-dicarboxylate transport system permease small subunit